MSQTAPVARSSVLALSVLTLINLINYLDRYVVAAIVPDLKGPEMGLTDAQAGTLMSAFMVVYTLAAPVFGVLGDRGSRTRPIAIGIFLWSLATVLSGFAANYAHLLGARALVGIGEAAYITIAPALLSDCFSRAQRGRVLSIFNMAIPVGAALGYIVGGLVSHHYGWRAAFFVGGAPGLLLALWVLRLPDPPRGSRDEGEAAPGGAARDPTSSAALRTDVARDSGAGAAPNAARDSGAGAAPNAARDSGAGAAPNAARDSGAGAAPNVARDSGAGAAPNVARDSGAGAAPNVARDSGAGAAPNADASARPSARLGPLATYWSLLRRAPYMLVVLGYAAYTFALGGLAFWMPTFLERVRGIPATEATTGFGIIVVVTGFLGTFAGGWLGDYWLKSSRQAYLWMSGWITLLAAPFAFVALTAPSPHIYYPAIVVAELLLFMSTGPINTAIINLVSPMERASAVALSMFVIHLLGDVPSPKLIGHVSDAYSLGKAVLIVPVAVVVGGIIWLVAAKVCANAPEPMPATH